MDDLSKNTGFPDPDHGVTMSPMSKAMTTDPPWAVFGLTSNVECQLLADLAASVTTGCIVEVGSGTGRATLALAAGSRLGSNAYVYSLDPHDPFIGPLGGHVGHERRAIFMTNVARSGLDDLIHMVNLSSEVVSVGWRQPVGMLWIDGDHRRRSTERDFFCWEPFLLPNAIVAFHDSTDPGQFSDGGPYQVVQSLSRKYKVQQTCERITVLRYAAQRTNRVSRIIRRCWALRWRPYQKPSGPSDT